MVHALIALAGGHVRAAWRFNPGSFAVAPILLGIGIQRIKELVE